eukprot:6700068-Alexandrium_andersonii.AAC.1
MLDTPRSSPSKALRRARGHARARAACHMHNGHTQHRTRNPRTHHGHTQHARARSQHIELKCFAA